MTERKNTLLENSVHDRVTKRLRIENEISLTSSTEQVGASGSSSSLILAPLLDFTSIHSDSDISDRFGEIARSLFYHHSLSISSSLSNRSASVEYEFLEVEFYLRKVDVHNDPFTHGTEEQSNSGRWYFHRAPKKSEDPSKSATSSGYRGGTRKGLDLTIGGPCASPHFAASQPVNGPRGGILLRSMRRLSDQVIISGPSLLVDEILRACGAKSIAELVNEKLKNDTSAFPSFSSPASSSKTCSICIKPRTTPLPRKPVVYTSPRIGLDLSHPGTMLRPTEPRIIFLQRQYRFFMYPELLTANGRAQTFLGVYLLVSEAEILNEEGVRDETARLTGLKRTVVDKYVSDYNDGRDRGLLRSFVGPAGKGASSSPSTYLRMMGTVSTLGAGAEASDIA